MSIQINIFRFFRKRKQLLKLIAKHYNDKDEEIFSSSRRQRNWVKRSYKLSDFAKKLRVSWEQQKKVIKTISIENYEQ